MKAYIHDNIPGDQRDPHDSGKAVTPEELDKCGVFYRYVPNLADVDALAKERNYKHRDIVRVTEEGLGGKEQYEQKLKMFYAEHLHEDEEIRYIQEGEGYFDIRNGDDQWVRILVEVGDLLVVPAGIYHRFTPSRLDFVQALRLFADEPKWEAKPRPAADSLPIRSQYLQTISS